MKNLKTIYKVFIILILIIVGYLIFFKIKKDPDTVPVSKEPVSLCYVYLKKTDSGFYDKANLRLDINGENVSGEFNNIPAETDSKVGKFEGTVTPVIQEIMGRRATLWWDSLAEGMQVKEELVIEFGDGSAGAFFGEMIDRGDGVYVYKNKDELSLGVELWQTSCEDLAETETVEKYIKDNIKTIASDSPVLGGSWYVVSLNVVPTTNSGEVVYEDGHIQSKATFEYEYTKSTNGVVVKNFLQNN